MTETKTMAETMKTVGMLTAAKVLELALGKELTVELLTSRRDDWALRAATVAFEDPEWAVLMIEGAMTMASATAIAAQCEERGA